MLEKQERREMKVKNVNVRQILFERLRYHETCALLDMELGNSPEQHIFQVFGIMDYLKRANQITASTENRIYTHFENLAVCFEYPL